jgi:hypothetical protein
MAKRVPKVPPTPAEIRVSGFKLDTRPDTPSYYVNYMGVSHTPFEFTLSAAKIPAQLSEEQVNTAKKNEPVVLETILQLIVPPLLIEGLILALTDQKKKYEETIAKVKANDRHNQPGKNLPVQ